MRLTKRQLWAIIKEAVEEAEDSEDLDEIKYSTNASGSKSSKGLPSRTNKISSSSNEQKTYKINYSKLSGLIRSIISEAMDLDLEKGDIILTGRFKNKRTVVKNISSDELGQPTVNGRKALAFRIEKYMPKEKWSKKSLEAIEFAEKAKENNK